MKDNILKGTGNSRYLKTSLTAGTTWNEALIALRNGNFPIDFNGINSDGFIQVGTPLDKENFMPDELAERGGLDDSAVPADFLSMILDRLSVIDERDDSKYLLQLSVNTEGYPTLTFSEVV